MNKNSRRWFLSKTLTAVSAGLLARKVCASSRVPLDSPPNVEAWLNAHPNVRDAIAWVPTVSANGGSNIHLYQFWPPVQKKQLQSIFETLWNDGSLTLQDPPPNLSPDKPDEAPATILAPSDAWNYYVSGIAQSLVAEIGQRVPWTVTNYSKDDLAIIFDARWIYQLEENLGGYRISANNNGYATPSPPDVIWNFLKGIGFFLSRRNISEDSRARNTERRGQVGIILADPHKSERISAIARLFDWCRYHLSHDSGALGSSADMKAIFQYSGFPPVSRVISGTLSSLDAGHGKQNWTAGCYGTTGFLSVVLRTVNIPVKQVRSCKHSLPVFTVDKLALSHGDDLYDAYSTPRRVIDPLPFPSEELLLTEAEFKSWFGGSEANACSHIGRRPVDLAIKYLPYGLTILYCKDKGTSASHVNGEVYKALKPFFTLEQLEATDLWGRLEKKLMEGYDCGGYYKNPYKNKKVGN